LRWKGYWHIRDISDSSVIKVTMMLGTVVILKILALLRYFRNCRFIAETIDDRGIRVIWDFSVLMYIKDIRNIWGIRVIRDICDI